MSRFVFVSFVFLGWGFYELSGGAEFKPRIRENFDIEEEPPKETIRKTSNQSIRRAKNTSGSIALASERVADSVPTQWLPTTKPDLLSQDLNSLQPNLTQVPSLTQPNFTLRNAEVEFKLPTSQAPEDENSIATSRDLQIVKGDRVNMRDGPGTNHAVLATLVRDQQVIVLRVSDSGWAEIQVVATGHIGWTFSGLLHTSELDR